MPKNIIAATRFFCVVGVMCFLFSLTAIAETWSQSGEAVISPLRIMSTLRGEHSLITADEATVLNGAYETFDDGAASFLNITSGSWSIPGTSDRPIILGGTNVADALQLGPYTVRVSGSGTAFNVGPLNANFGCGSFELLDGACLSSTGNVSFAVSGTGAKLYSTQTVTVVNSAITFAGSSFTMGYRNASYPSSLGRGYLYATNSTFRVPDGLTIYPYYYFKNGRYIFKDCVFKGTNKDYGFNVQIGAEVVIDGSDFTSARYRIGDSGFCHSDGSPTLTFVDGSLTTEKLFVGTGSSPVTAIVHQVSGVIDAANLTLCSSTQPARLHLKGGVLVVQNLIGGAGTRAKNMGSNGFAHLFADGGTIRSKKESNSSLIEGLDLAEIGNGGLTLDDNGFSRKVVQSFTDAPGACGTLVKTGAGTIQLASPVEYSVSTTKVVSGVLHIFTNGCSSAVEMDTCLVLRDSSTLSLAGDTKKLSVNSLVVRDCQITLDPGDSIVVSADADISGLILNFTTQPVLGEEASFITVKGTLSPASRQSIINASLANIFPEGTYGRVSSVDTADGVKFVFSLIKGADLSGETSWRGPGNSWSDNSNWSGGAPVETAIARFDDSTAPEDVIVSEEAQIGALSFEGDSFNIGGSGSLLLSSPGISYINAHSGTNLVSLPVAVLDGAFSLSVAESSSLEISGALTGGGIVKTGSGRLVLSGKNALHGTVSISGGKNVISNESALDGIHHISSGDGTLAFQSGLNVSYPPSATFALSSANSNGAVVFECDGDVTLSSFTPESGVMIKRGAGRLVLDATAGKISALSLSPGNSDTSKVVVDESLQSFPSDGTPPAGGFAGFTVSEGEVVVKGSSSEALRIFGRILVGMNAGTVRAQPALTFDKVTLLQPDNQFYAHQIGYKCANATVTNPVMRILNGSRIETRGIQMDYQYSAAARWPVLAVTNSTLTASHNSIPFSTVRQSAGFGALLASNSVLQADEFSVAGRTYSRLTGCTIGGFSGDYTLLSADRNIAGEVLFDGGTLLKCDKFRMVDYLDDRYGSELVLAFDDAVWDVGMKGLTLDESNMDQRRPKKFDIRRGGLSLQVARDTTFYTKVPFVGGGKLSLTGGGTISFAERAFTMTGCVNAVSSVVDFSAAGAVSNFTVSGSGVFLGAHFAGGIKISPSINDEWSPAAVPTFNSCSFSGKTTVDCSHDESNPLPMPSGVVVVAKYLGSAPDVASWRLSGTGRRNVRAVFSANDGEITMQVDYSGTVLIVK